VLLTWICGGTMFGNWAVGRPGHGDQADDGHQDRDDHGDDRPVDEELGHGALTPCSAVRRRRRLVVGLGRAGCVALAAAVGAAGTKGFGLTVIPGRTFCVPSAITCSPGCSP
jgi:hypothetical protein